MTRQDVTVAICTWNRAALLEQTLEGLTKLEVPEGISWELLVVDNNSTDDTQRVLDRYEGRLPLRRLFEPRQGHSHARNRAISEACGDLLVWTDDDVIVSPGWLAEYVRAARQLPHAAFFVGAIEPWFEVEPPAWIVRHRQRLRGVLVAVELGDEIRPYRPGAPAFGANIAFRLEVARRYPADPTYGRVGSLLTGGDDTNLIARVLADGGVGYELPEARLRHFVSAERLTEDYAWRWYVGSGHTLVRSGAIEDSPTIAGVPRWALRGYIQARLAATVLGPLRNEAWIRSFQKAARLHGVICETRSRHVAQKLGGRDTSVATHPAKSAKIVNT